MVHFFIFERPPFINIRSQRCDFDHWQFTIAHSPLHPFTNLTTDGAPSRRRGRCWEWKLSYSPPQPGDCCRCWSYWPTTEICSIFTHCWNYTITTLRMLVNKTNMGLIDGSFFYFWKTPIYKYSMTPLWFWPLTIHHWPLTIAHSPLHQFNRRRGS